MAKLEEINQVKVLYDEIQVNKFLSKGYKIIKILNTKKPMSNGSDEISPCFILGSKEK